MARNNKTMFSITNPTNKFQPAFTRFMVYPLILLFIILVIAAGTVAYNYKDANAVNLTIIGIYSVLTIGLVYLLNKKIPKTKMLLSIILVGFILRLTWALITPSAPVSDFAVMFSAAQDLVNGDNSAFMGLGYFGRFPHNTCYIVLQSFIVKIFKTKNALFAIKMMNVILSTLSIYLVYLICNSVFKDYKRTFIGTFIMAVFPASVLYVPVYCSENVAIPFYLLSIYLFVLVLNNKKNPLLLILSALMLSVGHLFRMIAYILVIAYVMYIFIYSNEKIWGKIRDSLFVIIPFFLLFILVGNTLVSLNITDRKLWDGSEPSNLTSALRGSNIESGGAWNPEDAKFVDERLEDRPALEKETKERILNRYTTTPPLELARFFIGKFISQWSFGDNAGAYWSEIDIPDENIKFDVSGKGISAYQIIYTIMLILIVIGLFNKSQHMDNKIVNLFYIIICGFGAAFLILETQSRYAFIISFIFAILPVTAFRESK